MATEASIMERLLEIDNEFTDLGLIGDHKYNASYELPEGMVPHRDYMEWILKQHANLVNISNRLKMAEQDEKLVAQMGGNPDPSICEILRRELIEADAIGQKFLINNQPVDAEFIILRRKQLSKERCRLLVDLRVMQIRTIDDNKKPSPPVRDSSLNS